MDQSPTFVAVLDALAELELYDDTDEARAARVLVHLIDLERYASSLS